VVKKTVKKDQCGGEDNKKFRFSSFKSSSQAFLSLVGWFNSPLFQSFLADTSKN